MNKGQQSFLHSKYKTGDSSSTSSSKSSSTSSSTSTKLSINASGVDSSPSKTDAQKLVLNTERPVLKSSLDIARFIKDQNKSSRSDLMSTTADHCVIREPTSSSTKLENKTEKSLENHKNVDMKHFLDSVEKISREKEEETGNGRLQMFELENLLKSHLISDDNKADGVFFARPISKANDQSVTEEDSSNFPSPPPLPPRPVTMASIKKTPTTTEARATFIQDKNSLIGELKSRFNNDCEERPEITKPKVRKLETNIDVVANPEKVVHKVAYNQYREMLNSYRRNK